MASTPRTPRRGLPRVPGGEAWPPAAFDAPDRDAATATPGADELAAAGGRAGAGEFARADGSREPVTNVRASGRPTLDAADAPPSTGSPLTPASAASPTDDRSPIRRGLPRAPGGEPWPPARPAVVGPAASSSPQNPAEGLAASASPRVPVEPAVSTAAPHDTADLADSARDPASDVHRSKEPETAAAPAQAARPRAPLSVPQTVWPGAAASAERRAGTDAKRIGAYTPLQWLGSTAVLGVFALALAGITVLVARFLLALGPGQEFLAAYPGEYHLPASAPVGIPVWLNWSHFLNSFFLLFIIRTGWQVRTEKRPAAFWSPRKNKRRRISLTLWFHQAIDVLWIVNGVVFVVLLFATGQWMRIVPTSWEVFPNALSAALQYVSLDWPTENGWVNYNSLQQLSYFAITFLAAPLAIVSGVRLSGVWPKDAERLNRLYPVEWARKVHFPVMVFFVAFIVVHVALVLATGALRNLNHMYAARGAVDPAAFTDDPTGLLIFAASLLVMAVGWAAARPAVLVPIARLFGEVKQR